MALKLLDIFLKFNPRKYKYKAYIIIADDVLSRYTIAIKCWNVQSAIDLSS